MYGETANMRSQRGMRTRGHCTRELSVSSQKHSPKASFVGHDQFAHAAVQLTSSEALSTVTLLGGAAAMVAG